MRESAIKSLRDPSKRLIFPYKLVFMHDLLLYLMQKAVALNLSNSFSISQSTPSLSLIL